MDPSRVCNPDFKDAACYPYCMAARVTGSASDGLVLYNAPDWRDKVHLMDRDCAMESQVNPSTAVQRVSVGQTSYDRIGTGPFSASKRGSTTTVASDPLSGTVVAEKWDPDLGCIPASGTRSTVASAVLPGYTPETSAMFRSLLLPGQPFAFAGDVTLTPRQDSAGNYFVSVERLYGNEVRLRRVQGTVVGPPGLPPLGSVLATTPRPRWPRLPRPPPTCLATLAEAE